MNKIRAAAIIPAAGSGTRMHADRPKQYLQLSGKPIIVHAIEPFTRCPFIDQIIVVVPAEKISETNAILEQYKVSTSLVSVIEGGRRRQDSVRAGLDALRADIEIVLVHDGARPLISEKLISDCFEQTLASGAAIAAVPVKDTLKRADSELLITATVDRSSLWQAQTPQGARKEFLLRAFAENQDEDVTDEASLLERAGIPVQLVVGEENNIKITRPEDRELAQSLMDDTTKDAARGMRIGHGFDAHRFSENRQLILGGVTVAHERGLDGHSDADVLTHALCDALLGAMGSGDIGRHFPDTDDAFKDISSLILLDRVMDEAASRGLLLINGDITIICQAPRLAPYISLIQETLARHCRCTIEQINIKATTTEKMGYTGRQEGISCHAVVLLMAS
jgi:2-C-methyl-D-erythritol 4-phosphate cytidylyltransferase/2-C-methyl-D-erythritol 2,4-cyclodiphosphate synthase